MSLSRLSSIVLAAAVVVTGALWGAAPCNIGAKIHVAVMVDDVPRDPIDDARLTDRAPDRVYEGWRLWRLGPLLEVTLDGSVVVLDRADGKQGGFVTPPAASESQAFFAADARGTTAVLLARPSAAQLPALAVVETSAPLTRIRVITGRTLAARAKPGHRAGGGGGNGHNGFGPEQAVSPDAIDAPREGDPPVLSIALADGGSAHWTLADLEPVPANQRVATERGEVSAWSLRDVATVLVGAKARIDGLSTAHGETMNISAEAWEDTTQLPILRVNQRGLWKFDWVDASTNRPGRGGSLRNVIGIRIATPASSVHPGTATRGSGGPRESDRAHQ